jgi:class 3 adenylate cyclase
VVVVFGVDKTRGASDFDSHDWHLACKRAWEFSIDLIAATEKFNSSDDIKPIIERATPDGRKIRFQIGLSADSVLFGDFGVKGTVVGRPIEIAKQLSAQHKAFSESQTSILVDSRFHSKSSMERLEEVTYSFIPSGMDKVLPIYRVRT